MLIILSFCLPVKMYCFALGQGPSWHCFTQILGLFNQVISRGTEYITRAMDIYVIVFPIMRMRFSHFRPAPI